MMTEEPPFLHRGHPKSPGFLIILIIGIFFTHGCADVRKPYSETRFMMGTLVDVVVYHDGDTAGGAVQQAFHRMSEVEQAAHIKGQDSPLIQLREGRGVTLSGDVALIMQTAMAVSIATSGAFDPTLGQIVDLWGLGTDQPRLPDPDEIHQALKEAGYRRVPRTGCCEEGQAVWLDLGGVAKGFAVDEAVRVLRNAGVVAGIVNAGGDLRSFGYKPGKRLWKIGIQDPDDPQELAGILEVGEVSVATSGDYQRYFEFEGTRYHHILDPSTGYPARSGIRSATVLARDCALADALATAAFVMGSKAGLNLLEGWEDVEGILISEDGDYHMTSGIGKKYRFEKR